MHTPIPRRDFMKWTALGTLAATMPSAVGEQEAAVSDMVLPPLPYAASALEPYIDANTMSLHHDKHHAGYVSKLDDALATSPELKGKSLDSLVSGVAEISPDKGQAAIRNHGGGHWNHSFFWQIMAPPGDCGSVSDDLKSAINAEFGSMEKLREAFTAAAMGVFGSGWAWLILRDGKLTLATTPNQDNPLMKGLVSDSAVGKPVLGIDVWEHAYYLNYQNRRAEYVSAWWKVVNWAKVSSHMA